MCVQGKDKPFSCCCGCKISTAVIIYAVLQGISLCMNIATLYWGSILASLLVNSPLIALAFNRDSHTVRHVNFVWQWVLMVLYLIGMTAFLILIITGSAFLADQMGGMSGAMGPIYIVWAIVFAIVVPIQYMWIKVFEAFRDELEGEDSKGGYVAQV